MVVLGTDSRLGWGFRLGDRADFQVLLELGPQTNTQPLANQGDSNTNNKRNTLENLANTLYAQRQKEKKEKLQLQQLKEQLQNQDEVKQQDNEASTWLKTWSKDMRNQNEEDGIKTLLQNLAKAKPGLAEGEIDAKSVIPEDESGEKKPVKKRAEKVKSTTEGALDDVNLD